MSNIAIASFIGGSYFGGSQSVGTLNLAELLTDLGYNVTLIHVGEVECPKALPNAPGAEMEAPSTPTPYWFIDCDRVKSLWPVVGLRTALNTPKRYDLLIDMVGILSTEDRRHLGRRNVLFAREHGVMREIEASIYPIVSIRRAIKAVDEVWMWDTLTTEDEEVWTAISAGKSTRRLPFFWTPAALIAHLESLPPANPQVGANEPWVIRISESNQRNGSSAIFPLVGLRAVYGARKLPIKSVVVHNGEQIKDNKFFQDNIFAHARSEGVEYNFVGRQRVCDWHLLGENTALLGHVRFAYGKYAYFDCAWTGIPIVHNSLWLKQLGGVWEDLYYEANSISGLMAAFERLPVAAARLRADLAMTRQRLLEVWGAGRAAVQVGWRAAVEGILSKDISVAPIADVIIPAVAPVAASIESKKTLVVAFVNMWEDFQPAYNFFTLLLEAAVHNRATPLQIKGMGYHEVRAAGVKPDLVVLGPYGDQTRELPPFPGVPTVFHTAEQVPVPLDCADVFLNLGFTAPTPATADRVIRLTHWMMSIDWFGADNERLVNPKLIPLERVCGVDKAEWERKQKFCAFVVSNPMNPVRNAAFHTIASYKHVDSAGRLYNNVGDGIFAGAGGGGGELRKLEYLKDYKFVLAYENQRAPGYVTEKILHAKAAGAVPIYWGARDVVGDFDERGFINANDLEGRDLITAVMEAEGRWAELAAVPALSATKCDEVRGLLAETARRILARVGEDVSYVPDKLGLATTPKSAPTPTNSTSMEMNENTPVVFATYTSKKFLGSLTQWMSYIEKHASAFKTYKIAVFLANDVDSEARAELAKTPNCDIYNVPTAAPADFPDFWEPQHYGWKLHAFRTLAKQAAYNGFLVLYSDAGSVMVRLPLEAGAAALQHGVCLYEDSTQLNKYWCSAPFKVALGVTDEELEKPQTLAGLIAFRAGSELAVRLFEEAWTWAQRRDVLAGPKWEGVLASGQAYGHRHDQSILSILGRRYPVAWLGAERDYCDESLRRTFITGRVYYVHRGDFKKNAPFMGLFTDSYVINLARRTDRLERFKGQNSIMKRVQVWPGVDGRAMELTPHVARLFRPNSFHWKKAVMGCSLSHLGLWQQLASEPGPVDTTYFIFEDDAKLRPNFEMEAMRAMMRAPKDFDVLYFGGVLPPNRTMLEAVKEPVDGGPWCRVAANQIFGQREPTRYFHFCAYGYVMSKRGAQKMMDIIRDHDGYYAVSDHMMCNEGNGAALNLYFLDSQPVGCIQEEDPKYVNSDFNNYGREDTFDSDLWNNDERFSEMEREAALAVGASLDVRAALAETRGVRVPVGTVAVAAPVPAPVVPPAAQTYKNTRVIYTFSETYDCMERDWLSELFQAKLEFRCIRSIPLGQTITPPPICIVQKPYMEFWRNLFAFWNGLGQAFYAIHLSDEHAATLDQIDWYSYGTCKGVVRNYVRGDVPAAPHILTVPLGYARGRGGGDGSKTASAQRQYVWSFEGTGWGERDILGMKLAGNTEGAYKLNLRSEWKEETQYDSREYCELLDSSKAVPVFAGNNVETFRMWEALEHGCVPLYVRQTGDEAYWTFLTAHLPLYTVPSWDAAGETLKVLTANNTVLDMYRATLLGKWADWKDELKKKIAEMFV
jgi:GR25 family glycosyltransferase involved in LPS biosynthesis